LTINYSPVGSGAGIAQLSAATVDFAGSDPALKAADKAKLKGPALQFPVAFGAITVSYNLSGVKTGLKLDGPTIGSIFMGKIKTWSDPAIKALNPGVTLPSSAITVIHRSDSSGTTAGFTKFLSATDPAWKASVGDGKDVKWPTGTGAKGNSGVAAAVKQTPGSVGYVEQAYALVNGFTYAAVKNSAGKFIEPTIPATSAAAVGIKVPADLGISTINSPNPAAYPIVSQTFIDTYADPCKSGGGNAGKASALKKLLTYAFGDGQKTLGPSSSQLPYAPLPANLASKDNAQLSKLSCNGSPVS
jgi:phosphate transport system substrate-binding protein